MVSCSQRSCSSRSGINKKSSGISFHRFPKDPERRDIWIKFVNRGIWKPTKYSALCSKHFLEKDIDRTSLSSIRLKDTAVPIAYITQNQLELPYEEMPSTPTKSTESNSHMNNSVDVTPRKRKLIEQLNRSQLISSERRRKLSLISKKLIRREKKLAIMKNIVSELKKHNYLEEAVLDILSKIGGPEEMFLRQYKKIKNQSLPRQYSEQLKVFALTLHYYSPAAYNFVRRVFQTCLPHPRTLSRWYQSIDGEPGFTAESFRVLETKSSIDTGKLYSLIIDEMCIRQHEEWVAEKDKCYGYVDMGTGSQDATLANSAFVFLLNCINDHFKIPVGYFLIAGITGEQKKGLVQQCLQKCHNIGIKVVSITCDGPPVNLTMAARLGCNLDHNNLKTSFKHPSSGDDVVLFLDPCHMLKLVRNTLGEKGIMFDDNNEVILWNYLKELNNLQEKESFHLANKLRSQHIAFYKQKMKVRLATQVFSESVASALIFCSEELQLQQFKGVEATARFVMIMNNLFDVLNSRNLLQFSYKKPISIQNYSEISSFLQSTDKYLSALKTNVGDTLLLDSVRHTGFLGLKVCIKSLDLLYKSLVISGTLTFLPLYKFSQDHIELFFGCIRSQGGYNNNPTTRQFISAYKKLLVHVELSDSFRGNCIPLEKVSILKCDPILQINKSSRDFRILSQDSTFNEVDVMMDHDYLPDTLSEYAKYVVAYIAGHVVHSLKTKIVCTECSNALISSTKDLYFFSFINKKNKGGLQYPSTDVFDICLKSEKIIKNKIIDSNFKLISTEAIAINVVKQFVNSNVFINLIKHTFDQSGLDNHRALLIKAVAEKYINVRLYYLIKNKRSNVESIRHQSNKIVLFKGQ